MAGPPGLSDGPEQGGERVRVAGEELDGFAAEHGDDPEAVPLRLVDPRGVVEQSSPQASIGRRGRGNGASPGWPRPLETELRPVFVVEMRGNLAALSWRSGREIL